MLLSYLHENGTRLQRRRPSDIVRIDVTASACHLPRKYDSNKAVFVHVHCIRSI